MAWWTDVLRGRRKPLVSVTADSAAAHQCLLRLKRISWYRDAIAVLPPCSLIACANNSQGWTPKGAYGARDVAEHAAILVVLPCAGPVRWPAGLRDQIRSRMLGRLAHVSTGWARQVSDLKKNVPAPTACALRGSAFAQIEPHLHRRHIPR
jgi:hypothetical protein